MSRALVSILTFSVLICNAAYGQVRPRITERVDPSRTKRLAQSTHPATVHARDFGRAQSDLMLERILLELQSSPEQLAALEQLIAEQHDPASPRYQRWLTPEQFGEQFGPSQQDIDAIAQWLEREGFRVNSIARGRRSMEFSGTARQVERAFHTEIHHLDLNGDSYVANMTGLSVPEAVAPVVGGLVSLHTFRRKPLHTLRTAPAPETALTNGLQGVSPYDFATIYNLFPLWNQGFDGAGQSIAIAGRSNIKLSDVATFRSTFGLTGNHPQVILNGPDPGIVSATEEIEADLDVQWAGAVAKSATIKFVVSGSTNATDGIDLSSQYIVTNNLAPVMSVSFGACEGVLGSSNSFYNSLWQQAAAQGISVFVSSGDAGAAGCDEPGSTVPGKGGLGVNGLSSTPYNISVGGTQFDDTANMPAYWTATNAGFKASARSYIPEVVWNESAYTSGSSANNLFAGGGGVSQLYATPAWQTAAGVPASDPGASAQHHRYVPDVSLAAAGHDGYLVIRQGGMYLVGGTSASSPSFAGLAAILAQYTGGRNGNLNPRLYSLASQAPAVYHDITRGTIAVPCAGGSAGCASTVKGVVGVSTGFAAGAGYDLATGLGSVDAYAMMLNWGSRPATAPAISGLSPSPMNASATAQTLTIDGTNFAVGATVQASYSGGPVTMLPVITLSPARIAASIVTGLASHTWSIVVKNPNGEASFAATLPVNAPAPGPAIAALSPNPMTASSAAQVLIVNGSGFQSGPGLTVTLSYPGGPVTTLTGSQVAFVNSGQVLALVTVDTAARAWSVTVTNPGGAASKSANLLVIAPPSIAGLTPNPMTHSTAVQTLTVTGSGFVPGSKIAATYPGFSAVLQGAQITSLSATQITAQINVGNTPRNWTIQVINPNGDVSNRATLQVSK